METNTTFQTLWDATKVVQKGKFVAIQDYLKKQEKSQSNFTLKELEKEEHSPKLKGRK